MTGRVFDVVVVGAGHAGCEAAAAAARLGRSVAMVTLDTAAVGRLSCNPAIGGLAKGHLVRELDALGGLMGRVADASTVQFRQLNTRKGLAVRSSRAQVDIARYPAEMARQLAAIEGLEIVGAEVTGLITRSGRVAGVELGDTTLWCESVILTTGTFLAGVLHHGLQKSVGGRLGDGAAHALSRSLGELGLRLGRLKTGTVPRLDGRTIAWDRTDPQTDLAEGRFSFEATPPPRLPQITCHLTYTNEAVHDLIRANLDRAPMFTGDIEGTGPRYCPSVEDKVHRFPDRTRHLLFLEPEGLDTHRVYVNGLSTSLPPDVQEAMLAHIPGLEDAVLLQPGYAVEYDFSNPLDLGPDLQHRGVPGLFLAGQVNGTSGYEEAAVQGFVAGVSAALGEVFHVERSAAYIGVLVDDLTQRGIGGEPYRMFTSRAEHRLLLREDNADRRLMPRGRALGLVDDATWAAFEARQEALERGRTALSTVLNPTPEVLTQLASSGQAGLRKPATAEELLRRPTLSWSDLAPLLDLPPLEPEVAEQLEIDVKYAGYIARAQRRAEEARRLEGVALPAVDWMGVTALSWEVRERLARARPATLGQLERLPGITPAAVTVVVDLLAGRSALPPEA
ncbi:MAG: tRNA uridine-5-carboxymethylaminomethyl(34) synthesis enzyme MnmG [Myxococcota bacterium]